MRIFRLGIRTLLLALPAFVVVGVIRHINIDRPHLGEIWQFTENLGRLWAPLAIFNVFWILAFLKFRRKPVFLQRALLTIPLFLIPHMITAIIAEQRLMIPLSFIIFPSSIFSLIELRKAMISSKSTN